MKRKKKENLKQVKIDGLREREANKRGEAKATVLSFVPASLLIMTLSIVTSMPADVPIFDIRIADRYRV